MKLGKIAKCEICYEDIAWISIQTHCANWIRMNIENFDKRILGMEQSFKDNMHNLLSQLNVIPNEIGLLKGQMKELVKKKENHKSCEECSNKSVIIGVLQNDSEKDRQCREHVEEKLKKLEQQLKVSPLKRRVLLGTHDSNIRIVKTIKPKMKVDNKEAKKSSKQIDAVDVKKKEEREMKVEDKDGKEREDGE